MPDLEYLGPHDATDVLGRTVTRGEVVTFTAAEAATLPAVSWRPIKSTTKGKES